ncbi:MAG: response regulator [Candidatus Riflebacteria bacterium]|nr:response regulator [Candidatus Riflebacteria bacterium]
MTNGDLDASGRPLPDGPSADLGRFPKWRTFAEGRRLLGLVRIHDVFYFVSRPEVRQAIASLETDHEHVSARPIHPGLLAGRLSEKPFVVLVDDAGIQFLDLPRFRRENPSGLVVLLATSLFIGCAPPHEAEVKHPYVAKADLVFYVGGTDRECSCTVRAALRCAEDLINLRYGPWARRFLFLVVDDEPRWFSEFLPVLYGIIGYRAAVFVARTYEEATRAFEGLQDDIICLITDVFIPRRNILGAHGVDLVDLVSERAPRIPIVVASKAEEAKKLSDVFLLPKGDPEALGVLSRYVKDFAGFDKFLFFDNGGQLIAAASSLAELRNVIAGLDLGILERYAARDYFSTWLYMHGFRELADLLQPRQERGDALRETLLRRIDQQLESVARERFEFLTQGGGVAVTAGNLEELERCIATVDLPTLQFNSELDWFSTWLMRRGHAALADALRPIHGNGEALRQQLLDKVRRHAGR